MKNLQIIMLIALISFSGSLLANGSKKVPPAEPTSVEETLFEKIIDVFTFE